MTNEELLAFYTALSIREAHGEQVQGHEIAVTKRKVLDRMTTKSVHLDKIEILKGDIVELERRERLAFHEAEKWRKRALAGEAALVALGHGTAA